jgi:hypothetical protein
MTLTEISQHAIRVQTQWKLYLLNSHVVLSSTGQSVTMVSSPKTAEPLPSFM